MDNFQHIPVMINECIDGLKIKNGGVYFDGTLGGGGHSFEILKRSAPNGRLFATDLDDFAINYASERLSQFVGRFNLIKDNFKNFDKIMQEYSIDGFDGILLDLGVSSFQLDDRSRGFSYLERDIELDMRMDKSNPLDAKKIINFYTEEKLKNIFFEYGEEKFSGIIAKNIVKQREIKEIKTVGELNDIIINSIPKKFQHDGHPAKRVYQAIRIEVNGELDSLFDTVLKMGRALKKGGRIVVLTFHSLEDRIVKNAFKELECDCICPKDFPVCVCGKRKEVEIITKHPIIASEIEQNDNSRSKCAKLRIAEKI